MKRAKGRATKKLIAVVAALTATHLGAFAGGYFYPHPQKAVTNTVSSEPNPIKVTDLPTVIPTDERAELTKDNILIRLNEQRLSAGLKQLPVARDSEVMAKTAQQRAEELNAKNECRHFFEGPYAETVSCGDTNATSVIAGFMASPTHRDVILDKRIEGIAVGISGDKVVILYR